MESFGNVFSCNGNPYEQLSYIDLSDCSSTLSPQSLLSPGSNIVMSPPAQQVPQDENLYDRMTDNNIFYEKTEVLKKPFLKIIDQPTKEFRFRYKSETGTHGCISGRSRKKSFPTIQLLNYSKDAIIMCSLVQNNAKHDRHPHSLVVWKGDKEVTDPHEVLVGPHNKFTARFPNMAILFTGKKSIPEELLKYKKQLKNNSLSPEEEKYLRISCENEAKSINLNSVCLKFSAFDNNHRLICDPIFSEAIDNSKSAETCQLKIVNISKTSGYCNGGDKIFLFVEKVNKKNIKIKFFEIVDDVRVWEDFAYFTELDVHHQYGIVFQTPPYRKLDITNDVNVFIELFRPKDSATSTEIQFRYKPMPRQSKKRRIEDNSEPLMTEGSFSFLNNEISQTEVPIFVHNFNSIHIPQNGEINHIDMENQRFSEDQAKIHITHQNFLPNFNDSLEQNRPNPDAIDIEKIIDEYTKLNSNQLFPNDNTDTYMVFDPVLFGNIVRDAPQKYPKLPPPENENKMNLSILKKIFENLQSENLQMFESPNKLVEKCHDMYHGEDIENLEMVSIMVQIYRKVPSVQVFLKNLLEEGLSDGETYLHLLIAIDEKLLLKLVLDFMNEHNLTTCINGVNKQQETALHRAINCQRLDLIDTLLSSSCNPNLCDENGNTPTHLCIINGNFDCLTCLLAYKNPIIPLDLNICNNDGHSPIHTAFISATLEMINLLMSSGADAKLEISTDGRTILHLAVERGDLNLITFIVEKALVSINASTYKGFTALHSACVSKTENAFDICKYLLENGADPVMKYDKNFILSIAANNKNPQVADIIREYIEKNNAVKLEVDEFLDENTIITVSKLLDKSGKWRQLAENLGFQSIISVCEQSESLSSSPSAILLNNVEMEGNVSAQDLYKLFMNLGINDAAEEIEKILPN